MNVSSGHRGLGLAKGGRLHHRTLVLRLFAEGKGVYAFPVRMVSAMLRESELARLFHGRVPADMERVQMLVNIPKKKQRRAVHRVLLRRRIKEAYRLHRAPLCRAAEAYRFPDGERGYMLLALLYASDEIADYATLEKKVVKLLDKAVEKLSESATHCAEAAAEEGKKTKADGHSK